MTIKKWKLGLLMLVFLAACKGADCGCPMAKNTAMEKVGIKSTKTSYKAIISD
ncbi:MAG: hypothetical protein AAGJ18_14660 [Bacteroidota bacterium]